MDDSSDLPPLPDYAKEFRPRWPGDKGGFTADQMQAYARAAVEAERVKLLEAFELEHLYQGGCPDEFSDPRRDPNCPACRALVALGIGEFTS